MSAGPSEMDAFLAAIDRSPAERDAYLSSLDDPALAARVRALIAAHDDLGDDEPVRISNPHLALPARPETLVGKIVDGFEITGILGRGGMGIVFDARQLAPERRVALKTIAQVVADETDLLRFEREGKFLARLAHPGIAHVYGVGRAEALGGLPYLAMEFIDGEPIDRWVASRALSIDDRLRLLAETAETTAHVHVRGVIHRDLKPANILVDREGRTKILDFGIARLDDRDGGGRSQETRTGQILGTLPYMSPEQVGGDPSAVDGRTDVYALGVIAYELLAGRLPLDLSAMALPSAVRKIVEVEPPSPAAFDARLRGDVETVVKKAIAKSPNDRYATAAEFAADIRRILSHEPIVARPPSRIYRLRKLVRRNRVAFTGLAAVICSLTFGLGWALIERDRAVAAGKAADVAREKAVTSEAETAVAKVAAEKSAERERLRAQSTKRLNQLLAEMIGRSTPHENGGRAIEVAEMVDELAQKIDDTFTNDPYVRAWVHLYLSRARRQSGRYDDARRHLASAKSAFEQSPLTDAADRIEVKCYEALPGLSDKSPTDTIEELRALLDTTKSIDDDGRAEALVAMSLATLLARENRDVDTAATLAKDALRITERRFGRSSPEYATDLHSLGFVLSKTSRSDECLAAYEEAAAIRRANDPVSLALAATLENIGHKLQEIRRIDDALPYYKESLDIKRKVFGSDRHVEFGYGLDNFGTLLRDLGQVKESLPYFEEAAEIFRAKLGEESEDLGIALNEHATALRHLSQTEKAQALSDRAVAILRKTKKSTSTALAAALELNGTLALDRGDGTKGLELGREALAIREAAHGKDDHRLGRSIVVYATGLLFLERWKEAEDLGRRSLTLRKAHWGANSWQTYEDAHIVYFALARQKKFEEAEELAEDTLEIMRKELGRDHRRSKVALLNFSGILRLQGKIDEAKALEAELKRP